jgi:Helix-turn-helix domain
MTRRTHLSAANGGWVRVTIDDDPPFDVRVRPNERGRLEVVELRLAPGGPIDSTTLRRVQLAHVEAQVNVANLREYIVDRLEVPGPMVFDRTDAIVEPGVAEGHGVAYDATVRVTEHASGEAHGQQRVTGQASGRRVEVELTDSVSVADSLTVEQAVEREEALPIEVVIGARRPRARLRVPTSNPKPLSFYRQVADAYMGLRAQGNRPAVELAEANGVPVTTVHRWIRRARELGFLGPGQKGRAG